MLRRRPARRRGGAGSGGSGAGCSTTTRGPTLADATVYSPGPPPAPRVPLGTLRVTPVGHATFLVQMDGLNILFDPIWSERCSPISWAGPRRHKEPGIRFEDLPPIDVVLISHNHYDHLDLPTLERLAQRGTPRALAPLGNGELIREAGIPSVTELDWWESVPLSPEVTVTLVPARHFSARTLWDRNRTLWGGFVVSGPSGNLFHAGDTGYGPHFRQIAERFSPIKVALLPISPFRPQRDAQDFTAANFSSVHMGPAEAVRAHLDLGAQTSIAGHFQVFHLGTDGFDDAVNELALTLKERNVSTRGVHRADARPGCRRGHRHCRNLRPGGMETLRSKMRRIFDPRLSRGKLRGMARGRIRETKRISMRGQ